MLTQATTAFEQVPTDSGKEPKRILLVRLSALGDVVQTFPVVTYIRGAFPTAQLGWVIDKELMPVVEGYPGVDHLHVCDLKQWWRAMKSPSAWQSVGNEMLAFMKEIRDTKYDIALDVQGLFKTALITQFSGAKLRIGLDHGRELTSLFYDQRFVKHAEYFDESVFRMEHMKVLGRAIGCPDAEFSIATPPILPAAASRIAELLKEGLIHPAPLIVIAPGTQWSSKAWPVSHWKRLVQNLLDNTRTNIVFVSGKGDAELVGEIVDSIAGGAMSGRILNLAGQTNVKELYALFARAQVAIGSDSAPLHIAGAMKVPTLIGFYGPTGYRRTAPLGSSNILLFSSEGELDCQPCHKKLCPLGTTECMFRIDPDKVFAAVVEALRKRRSGSD